MITRHIHGLLADTVDRLHVVQLAVEKLTKDGGDAKEQIQGLQERSKEQRDEARAQRAEAREQNEALREMLRAEEEAHQVHRRLEEAVRAKAEVNSALLMSMMTQMLQRDGGAPSESSRDGSGEDAPAGSSHTHPSPSKN